MNVIKLSRNTFFTCLVALCFLMATLKPTLSMAQSSTGDAGSTSADFIAPVILLDERPVTTTDEAREFSAQVTDNTALSEVTLHYRFDESSAFVAQSMTLTDSPDVFSTNIVEIPENATLFFYIEATDTAGNKTFKGHAFSPLERQLVQESSAPITSSDNQTLATEPTRSSNKLYWILGAVALLALGGLAAGGGGGDDGSGNTSSNCGSNGCVVNLQLTNP